MTIDLTELAKLSVPEKLALMEELWTQLSATPDQVPIPQWQWDELQRRREAHLNNPQPGVTWEELRDRLLQQDET